MIKLAIIGGGPAGLTASIYASRYKIEHKVFTLEVGGYLNEIHQIENYPGLLGIAGFDLAQKMAEHALKLGGEIINEEIKKVEKKDDFFLLRGTNKDYQADKIIFATGTKAKKLEIPGEKEFLGKGVSYCATCDAPFFKNKRVAVIGGGNAAAVASLILSQHAKEVVLFYRGNELKCTPSYLEQMKKIPNIKIECCSVLTEIKGKERVEKIELIKNNYLQEELLDGVFIEIGSVPDLSILDGLNIETDQAGFIKTNPDQSTNLENFYAAGDITTNSNGFRQIITAAAEGAVAVLAIFEKIKQDESKKN